MKTVFLLALILMPLTLNIKASWLVFQDHFETPNRRVAQVLLVWLLPLVGALLVLGIRRHDQPQQHTDQTIDSDAAMDLSCRPDCSEGAEDGNGD